MKVGDVCAVLDEWAPPESACAWDRAGLAIGAMDAKVDTVLVALSITAEAVRAAIRARAQLVVTHHPPIWEPLKALRTDDPATQLLLTLTRANIACYSVHTNLDVAPGGVNDVLAGKLGLIDVRPLLPHERARQVKLVTFVPDSHIDAVRAAVCSRGAGRIGDYTFCTFSTSGTGTFVPGAEARPFVGEKRELNEALEHRFEVILEKARLDAVVEALVAAHPYEEVAYDVVSLENSDSSISLGRRGRLQPSMQLGAFARHVRRSLQLDHVRVCGPSRKPIHSVAVIGGSGGGELTRMPNDIDALVTGDVKYHSALDARVRNLAVIDAGHAGTERWIVPVIAKHLRARLPRVRVKTYIEPEPFRAVTD